MHTQVASLPEATALTTAGPALPKGKEDSSSALFPWGLGHLRAGELCSPKGRLQPGVCQGLVVVPPGVCAGTLPGLVFSQRLSLRRRASASLCSEPCANLKKSPHWVDQLEKDVPSLGSATSAPGRTQGSGYPGLGSDVYAQTVQPSLGLVGL